MNCAVVSPAATRASMAVRRFTLGRESGAGRLAEQSPSRHIRKALDGRVQPYMAPSSVVLTMAAVTR